MATLRFDPPRKWGWTPWTLPGRTTRREGIEEYQASDEQELFVTRRHPVALAPTIVTCLGVVAIGWAAGIGSAVIPPVTLFFGWRVWRWREAWYVLTNHRLLYVDGIAQMRVKALPLGSVLDATCDRSLAGRLLGYGEIRLRVSLSEQSALRKLTRLPRPETLYLCILSLTAVRDVTERSPLSEG
jgi:Bacterial PH domain